MVEVEDTAVVPSLQEGDVNGFGGKAGGRGVPMKLSEGVEITALIGSATKGIAVHVGLQEGPESRFSGAGGAGSKESEDEKDREHGTLWGNLVV